jgi:hypothetical protein
MLAFAIALCASVPYSDPPTASESAILPNVPIPDPIYPEVETRFLGIRSDRRSPSQSWEEIQPLALPQAAVNDRPFTAEPKPSATASPRNGIPEIPIATIEIDEDILARQDLPVMVPDDVPEAPEPQETPTGTATERHSRRRLPKEMHFGLSLPSLLVVVSVTSLATFLVIHCYRRPVSTDWGNAGLPLLIPEMN